ncbi:MAG: MATE family efflux transporter [Phycisphaerales bacterium]
MPATEPQSNRHPLLEMALIAAPVVATMTSYTLMQFVDKLMVSRIGPDPIYVGAQGNGGLAAFVLMSIMMGFITVINTYVSQNLGAGRPERAPAYVWTGMWMAAAFWLAVLVPFALALPWIFELMRGSAPAETISTAARQAEALRRDSMAAEYARILLFGSVITLAARAIAQYFYGMHRPMVVLLATLTGNLANIAANSVLIYGPRAPEPTGLPWLDAWFNACAGLSASLNIPAMGINGAAYGTVLGTVFELAIPMALFLSPAFNRRFRTLAPWRPSLPHARDLYRIGWPGALMFGNEMICWSFFMVYLVGTFGALHSTAGWIAHQWMSLSFMPTVGISVAITATVGKALGARRPDLAAQRARQGLTIAVAYMSLCGIAFVLLRRSLVEMFIPESASPDAAAEILRLGAGFLIAAAAFQFFDGVAMSLSGALRGAGDTRWVGVVTLLLSWTLIVAGGLFMVRAFPRLQSLGPWIAAAAYIIVLALAILYRWRSGKWRTMRLVAHDDPPPAQPALAATAAGQGL